MIKKIFLKGLFITLPIVITIYVLLNVFQTIDNVLQPLVLKYLGINIVGLGFIIVVTIIFVVGLLSKFRVGKYGLTLFQSIMNRIPIVNKVYNSVNEVIGMIGDESNSAFSKVVRVEFPMKGIYSIGFVTNDTNELHSIFIPTTPNPTNGFLIYTKKYEVLDIAVDKAMKQIVSMGVIK